MECAGQPAIRQRVEALLQADAQAATFASETPPIPTGLPEQSGDRIGRYKLLERIGEGGCGVVYMAEQEEPVRRRVALKIIKLGLATRSVIARFEAERQALALMKVVTAGMGPKDSRRPRLPGAIRTAPE